MSQRRFVDFGVWRIVDRIADRAIGVGLANGLDPEEPPVLFILGLWRTYRCACASHRLA